MNIISAQYTKTKGEGDNTGVIATVDNLQIHVPLDPDNRHYTAILEWAKEDGNEIQEAE
jgi:hypothetical protein